MKDIPLLDPVTELKKLFDAKKFDAAIEFCQKLLEKDANDPIALVQAFFRSLNPVYKTSTLTWPSCIKA